MLGHAECLPLGGACPTDGSRWPSEEELRGRVGRGGGGRLIHVAPLAGDEPGDGSRSAPLGSVAAALEVAEPGDIVAIGVGTYDEAVQVQRDVALVGACVTQSVVRGAEVSTDGVVRVSAADVWLSDLTVRGPRPGVEVFGAARASLQGVHLADNAGAALWVRDGAEATISESLLTGVTINAANPTARALKVTAGGRVAGEGLTLEDNQDTGLYVIDPGSSATVQDALVRRTAPRPSTGVQGLGLFVTSGGTFEGARLWFDEGYALGAIFQGAGARGTISDVVISRTRPEQARQLAGRGLSVIEGAELDASRVWIDASHDIGLIVQHQSAARIADLVVTDTAPVSAVTGGGIGVIIADGGQAEIEGAFIARNTLFGVGVEDPGSRLTLRRAQIVDTRRFGGGRFAGGRGINVVQGGELEGQGLYVARNGEYGVAVGGVGTRADIEGLELRDTHEVDLSRDDNQGRYSMGVVVFEGGALSGSRWVLDENSAAGLVLEDSETRVSASDVVIRRTRPNSTLQRFGRGVIVELGGALELRRATLEENGEVGLYVAGEGSEGRLADVVVRGTAYHPETGAFGLGIGVSEGGSLEGERVLLERNHSVGLLVNGPDAEAALTDFAVVGTRANAWDGGEGGHGVLVRYGALVMERFRLVDNELAGLYAADEAELEARRGEVRGNLIGINARAGVEGLDLEPEGCVDVRDNCCGMDCASGVVCNVESEDLPIPAGSDALDAFAR